MRKKLFSLRYRIAGMTFLLLTATVCALLLLANLQMHSLFSAYLQMPQVDMGQNEMSFLHSVHESLIWVGVLFILLGFGASLLLANTITRPLQALTQGAEDIRHGRLGIHIEVTSQDEIGQLTDTFNKMSSQLAQTEESRRKFLADTAHELRTPLAILSGNLENMLEGVSAPTMEGIFSMHEEVQRLTRLVESLREVSLAELHQLPLHKQPSDINQMLLRAQDMFLPLLEEKGLSFISEPAPDLPSIEIDRDRINQVLYNLISNAIRYSSEQGTITLRTELRRQNGRSWLITSIADDGSGIPAEDLPHVFEHFYRGDKSRNRKSGGTGIGLSLVKYYTEAHNGWVEVQSTAGEGTEFTLWLPV